jgi:hypothetical protein
VIDVSRRGDDEIAVRKLAGMIADGRFVIEVGTVSRVPSIGTSKRLIRESRQR